MASLRTAEEIDELLDEASVIIGNIERDAAYATRKVKAQSHEADMLRCIEQLRDSMSAAMGPSERDLLGQLFGGDCTRIARIRETLSTVKFSTESNRADPRTVSCTEHCNIVEAVLRDLGHAAALSKAHDAIRKQMIAERQARLAKTWATADSAAEAEARRAGEQKRREAALVAGAVREAALESLPVAAFVPPPAGAADQLAAAAAADGPAAEALSAAAGEEPAAEGPPVARAAEEPAVQEPSAAPAEEPAAEGPPAALAAEGPAAEEPSAAAGEAPAAEGPSAAAAAGELVMEAWRQSRLYDLLYGSPAVEQGPAAALGQAADEPGAAAELGAAAGLGGSDGLEDGRDESESKPATEGEISALELMRNADLSGAMPMYGAL